MVSWGRRKKNSSWVAGQLVDLALVQMRDRVQVDPSVAVLHEEAAVVFVLVGGPDDGVVPEFRVVVDHGHAGPLLEVRGRHDLSELRRLQARALLLAVGRDDRQGVDVQSAPVQQAGNAEHPPGVVAAGNPAKAVMTVHQYAEWSLAATRDYDEKELARDKRAVLMRMTIRGSAPRRLRRQDPDSTRT